MKIHKVNEDTFIYDIIRKKEIILTPEEWVRQHFLHFMIHFLKVPEGLVKMESSLTAGKKQKRSDILVFSREVQPIMLVECKAPSVPISQKTLDQAITYNKTLKAKCIILTNGMMHYCYVLNDSTQGYEVKSNIPLYSEL